MWPAVFPGKMYPLLLTSGPISNLNVLFFFIYFQVSPLLAKTEDLMKDADEIGNHSSVEMLCEVISFQMI